MNFITPHAIEVGKVHPRVAYELSRGKVGPYVIWGVTFVGMESDGTTWRAASPEFSSCFMSRPAAEVHVLRVKQFLAGRRLRASLLAALLDE